ncbi:MAG: hypothetical protein QG589_461 [Patescibacteria group bacterium]|nr:hypothetical protein [Patescibacteria group bacterium]
MTIIPFLNKLNNLILNPLILLLFTLATAYFVYGIVKLMSMDAGDTGRKEAQRAIFWGLVGMLIMFSVYGIIRFVLTTFGVSGDPTGYLPRLQ